MVQQNEQMVHTTRTKTFCLMDIGFWKEDKVLSWKSKLHILFQDNAVTLKISNQNNSRMGQTLHHETTGPKGAVVALERLVHHILSSGGS